MQRKKYNDTEVAEVLKQIAELLLDENVEAKVATGYYTFSDGWTMTKKIDIPRNTVNGWITGNRTSRTNRATSIKIGNFTIRPSRSNYGFNIITPEGKDYLISLSMPSHLRAAATYLWEAAKFKCDKVYPWVTHYINEIRYIKGMRDFVPPDLKMTKGPMKTKFEKATEQMESLGIPKESQIHLQKLREGRE